MELFIAGVTARTAADLINVHRNMAAYGFHWLGTIIMEAVNRISLFDGEVELDESYFGAHRKETRGRGAGAKQSVICVNPMVFLKLMIIIKHGGYLTPRKISNFDKKG